MDFCSKFPLHTENSMQCTLQIFSIQHSILPKGLLEKLWKCMSPQALAVFIEQLPQLLLDLWSQRLVRGRGGGRGDECVGLSFGCFGESKIHHGRVGRCWAQECLGFLGWRRNVNGKSSEDAGSLLGRCWLFPRRSVRRLLAWIYSRHSAWFWGRVQDWIHQAVHYVIATWLFNLKNSRDKENKMIIYHITTVTIFITL